MKRLRWIWNYRTSSSSHVVGSNIHCENEIWCTETGGKKKRLRFALSLSVFTSSQLKLFVTQKTFVHVSALKALPHASSTQTNSCISRYHPAKIPSSKAHCRNSGLLDLQWKKKTLNTRATVCSSNSPCSSNKRGVNKKKSFCLKNKKEDSPQCQDYYFHALFTFFMQSRHTHFRTSLQRLLNCSLVFSETDCVFWDGP